MKKALVTAVVLGLLAGALALPADAKKKAKPVATSLYFHGTQQAGEAELPDTWASSAWMTMDSKKPDGAAPKSMFVTNYLAGPNTTCSGNGLLPTWKGPLAGTVKGDLKLTLHTIGSPAAKLQADVFPDGTGGCDSTVGSTGYVPPVATAQVDVAPGPGVTEITFPKVNFKAVGSLVVMFSIPGAPANPYQVRILYDGAGYESGFSFSCTPATGTSCTP